MAALALLAVLALGPFQAGTSGSGPYYTAASIANMAPQETNN